MTDKRNSPVARKTTSKTNEELATEFAELHDHEDIDSLIDDLTELDDFQNLDDLDIFD